jgi:hypothetical protein
MTALTTLPYQMLSEFHQDDLYVNKSPSGIKRGFLNIHFATVDLWSLVCLIGIVLMTIFR